MKSERCRGGPLPSEATACVHSDTAVRAGQGDAASRLPYAAAKALKHGARRGGHAVCRAKNRSASMAAMQPIPAAVTAWR